MKRHLFPAAVLLLALFFIRCIQANDLPAGELEVVHRKENRFDCTFEGVKHGFILDLPEKSEGAPLVLLLPGYGNTAESFRLTTHFEQDANPLGYAVAYVTGARDPNNPIGSVGWNSGISPEGNDDTAFLTSLAEYLQQEYSFDRERTFAVGFSNGAFMAHRLAMEAGDTFSACVSVAGMMPAKIWQNRNDTNNISFFQITGEKDDVVPKNSDGSAAYSKNPAIEDVMAYWASSDGLDISDSDQTANGSVLTKHQSDEKPDQVWDLLIKNGRHSWPDIKMTGIDANCLILEFFDTVSH